MRLTAIRQLRGDYGLVAPGQEFECSDEVGQRLLETGVAFRPLPPHVTYETKVITPEAPEVSARRPFRDVPDPDPEPAALAALRDSVRATSDVQPEGNPGDGGRGKRGGPDPAGSPVHPSGRQPDNRHKA